jgi:hypothetical protein
MIETLPTIEGARPSESEMEFLNHIVQYMHGYAGYRDHIQSLLNAYEGQLTPMVRESMRQELSPETFQQAKHRIPSFNLLKKIVTKLSKVYNEPVNREADKSNNQEALELWEQAGLFDTQMAHANTILNLCKAVALEPYATDDGRVGIRVMAPNLCMPYSDDVYDPSVMTAMIKLIRHAKVPYSDNRFLSTGEDTDPQRETDAYLYEVWTQNRVYKFWMVMKDTMQIEDPVVKPNPLGIIPFVWIKRSQNYLIPEPDMDLLETTILIPKIYADLAYAVMFNSFGMLATVDLDMPDSMTKSPNQIWALQSSEAAMNSSKQGKITPLKAEVDIEDVKKFAADLAIMALESRNIKAGSLGKTSEQRASGAAKVVDQADVTEDIIQQQGLFAAAEHQIWEIIKRLHNANIRYLKAPAFSSDFKLDVRFPASQIVTNFDSKLAYVERQMALNLMTKRQALKYLRPEMTEAQTDKWLNELEEEQEESMQEVMSAISGKAASQFSEGNQSAGGQNNEKGPERSSTKNVENDQRTNP